MRGPLVAASAGGDSLFQNLSPPTWSLETPEVAHKSFPNSCGRAWHHRRGDDDDDAHKRHMTCLLQCRVGGMSPCCALALVSAPSCAVACSKSTASHLLRTDLLRRCDAKQDATNLIFTAAVCSCALFAPLTPRTCARRNICGASAHRSVRHSTISRYRNVAIDYVCRSRRPVCMTAIHNHDYTRHQP